MADLNLVQERVDEFALGSVDTLLLNLLRKKYLSHRLISLGLDILFLINLVKFIDVLLNERVRLLEKVAVLAFNL